MASVFIIVNWSFFNDLIIIVTKKGSQARVVTATITMLYLLVFESPVRSGLSPPGQWTETETGPPKS